MTEDQLISIERQLGVVLPAEYRKLVCPYPIPALAGNGEDSGLLIWDSPSAIVAATRDLWESEKWPQHYLCIGCDDGGTAAVLDLEQPECRVIEAFHRSYTHVSNDFAAHPLIQHWSQDVFEAIRVDLFERGVREDTTPEEFKKLEAAELQQMKRGCLLWVGIPFAVVLLIRGCSAML